MMKRTVRAVVPVTLGLALAGLLGSGTALAEDPPAPGAAPAAADAAAAPAPTSAPAAPSAPASPTDLTLKQGGVSVDGDVVINMSKELVGKPIQIVPNLYYGVTSELTAGVTHNPGAEVFQAGGGFAGGRFDTATRGVCITGVSKGCEKVYNNISADALFSFMRARNVDLAAHGGVDFLFLDPFWLSLRLGVKGKAMAGPLVIVVDPALNLGLINRNDGNKELLALPARVGLRIARLDVGGSIGLFGPIDHFSDLYTIPVGFGAAVAVNGAVDVRAQFTFTNLAGKNSSADGRALSVGAGFHM